jgi:flagellar motor switch protein FliN/FliY
MAETEQVVEEQQQQQQQDGAAQEGTKTEAQSVELSEARETAGAAGGGSIDILLDMSVPVTITIGQTDLTVRRLLQLGPGAVLKLDKPVDAPVDLYLKDVRFATGDVVVVNDRFAVRIKQILSAGGSGEKK